MKNKHKKTHIQLLLLVVISLFPVIIGGLLYHYHSSIRFHTLNYGTLVRPPIPSEGLLTSDVSQRRWQIVYMPTGCCDERCDQLMYTLHQLRKVLGKESKRVDLKLVVNETCRLTEIHDFQRFIFTTTQYTHLKNSFDQQGEINFVLTDKIYLIDPAGNLFMYYPSDVNPMDILKDLKRVLEVSQIG